MPYKDPEKQAAAQRASYERHKERVRERQPERRKKMREWLNNYKRDKPCADCGVVYPLVVMDLDHLPEFQKVAKPSALGTLGSIAALEREVAKCEIVCSNCHRLRTHTRLSNGGSIADSDSVDILGSIPGPSAE